MKKITRRILSTILVVYLIFLSTVPVFAVESEDEEYLSDLRIVYADDLDEATEILEDSGLEGYKLFNANLNENTGKRGVWLAYQTTTDIEDAITDIAIMQMNGGYNEGNYQEMIQQSLVEYEEMGENYLTAIEYFNNGIDAGHYLSEIAHRQLNFYNVVTEGIDKIPDFEGERLGDIFYDEIDIIDLATMFMEGNSYALKNIRSLIAMGVSYNENGKTYLENVADEAEKYSADNSVYDNEDYEDIAAIIAPTITVFRDMLEELDAHESDLNYDDDEITELELKYMEYKLIAEMLKNTAYIHGETLYDFCLDYYINGDSEGEFNNSDLYPLVAALNDGQVAMTKVAHYYDVVRYSVTFETNDDIEAELAEMEEEYGEYPFNVYTGVDRTIYEGTFALTSEAYRADAYNESGLSSALYEGNLSKINIAATAVGGVGVALFGAGLARYGYLNRGASKAASAQKYWKSQALEDFKATVSLKDSIGTHVDPSPTRFCTDLADDLNRAGYQIVDNFDDLGFQQKVEYLTKFYSQNPDAVGVDDFATMQNSINKFLNEHGSYSSALEKAESATLALDKGMGLVYGLTAIGGFMMLMSAITLGIGIYNYYHPEYTDIPTAMVDLIDTPDGDRYIKYDVVYEAEPQADGTLIAADLNAFQANRWNAMYYTKSYEAGKPLLADEFVISNTSNIPAEKHMPVHRFGEVVCYNLNKYNFNDDHTIYLSVKQSDNQKAAVERVPEVVGSVFSAGYMILVGGVGLIVGAGGTIGMMEIIKRRKNKKNTEAEAVE